MAVAAALWLHPDPAECARITAVRVGTHPGYARVVLETDAPADYEVLTAPAATPGEVTLWIAAESRARDVAPSGPDSPAVSLLPQDDGTTLARIRAPGPLRVETQVLTAPPRLVLDLRRVVGEAAVEAPTPAPPPPAPEIPLLPPPEAVETPEATPQEVAVTPSVVEPAPVEAPAPEPTPPPEPAPVATPTAIEAPPPVASPPPPREIAAPPVARAPRADLGMDPRSLVVGLAAGIGLALVAFASRRRREQAVAVRTTGESAAPAEAVAAVPIEAAEPAAPSEPSASPEAGAELEPAPASEVHDESMLDVLRMHQRLDARLAEIADRLGELAQRQARLDARAGAEIEEIASHRAALARLQRSLSPTAPIRAPRQVP